MFAAPFSLPSSRPSRSFPPRNDSLIYPISVSLVKKQVKSTPGRLWLRFDTAGAKPKARRVVAPSEGNQARRKRTAASRSALIVPVKGGNGTSRTAWREARRRIVEPLLGKTANA